MAKALKLRKTSFGKRLLSTKADLSSFATVNENVGQSPKEIYYKNLDTKAQDLVSAEEWSKAKPFETIPGHKPLPLIGNIWRYFPVVGEYYNKSMLEVHQKQNNLFGDVVFFGGIPGRAGFVMLYNVADMEKLFRFEGPWPVRHSLESFAYYRTNVRDDVFQGVGGVMATQGEEWYKFRSKVNKYLMQPKTAQMYVGKIDTVVSDFIEHMRRLSKNPNHELPKDFQNDLYKWTLESMGVLVFNKRFGCLSKDFDKNSDAQKLINCVTTMFKCMYKLDVLPPLWKKISTPTWRKYVKTLDFLTFTNLKHVQESFNELEKSKDLPESEFAIVHHLMKHGPKVTIAMAIDLMIAGVDTVGRTMAAALYFLAKNPDKQQLLREEMKKHLPNKDSQVTKEMLAEMPYLKAVIKETSRLSPIAIAIERTTVSDMVLGEYQIPKGTSVLALCLLSSHDEKHFKDASSFRPERWLRDIDNEYSSKYVNQFATLPFGFGPRSCIGKRIANLELEVGLAKIIRNFNISWPHRDAKFGITLLYGIVDPLRFRLEDVQ